MMLTRSERWRQRACRASLAEAVARARFMRATGVLLLLAGCGGDDTTSVSSASLAPAPSSGAEGEAPGVAEPDVVAPSAPEPASPGPGAAPLYLAASWVTNAETTNTYVTVFDSLEIDQLDFGNAIEIPGYGDAWVHEGQVFIADGESPRVGRYSLGADGVLHLDVEIDFSAYGVSSATFYNQEFLTPTKAYLSNAAALEYVVWNPTTMEITGSVPWPDFDFGAGFEPFNSYTDRGGIVQDGYLYHGFYAHDVSWSAFGQESVVAVYDIETDELVSTIDVPCPMMDVASLGDDGYIYVSGWSYIPLSYLAGYSSKNCAARIDVSRREADPDWVLNYADVTDGAQGSALRAVSGNDGIFAVFHGSGVPVTEGMDMWDLDAGENDWELYGIDLEQRSVAPTGIIMADGSYYESHVDGRYFVYLASSESSTRVWERTPNGYEPKFEASGWMSRLFRLR